MKYLKSTLISFSSILIPFPSSLPFSAHFWLDTKSEYKGKANKKLLPDAKLLVAYSLILELLITN